jgi:hypothetical protein
MTGTWSSRARLIAIALGAFVLRVFPFFGPDGANGYRVDYDEGVYFSAASYLLEGVLPWRDYVFVHPPGLLLFVAATSAWTHSFLGVAGAFALARWLAAIIGVINTVLVVRIVSRWGVPWAGCVAGAFYATYSEVVQVERGAFLEPLLNLICLALVLSLAPQGERVRERGAPIALTAVLSGLAIAIKLWAVIWVLGALWALQSFATRRQLLRFLLITTATSAILILPFSLQAPGPFLTQVGLFHTWRPPDGTISRLDRLTQIVSVRHLASPLMASLAVALITWRRKWDPLARVTVTAWVLTLVAFFASAAWWNQYNAHLIASEALVAGSLFALVGPRLRWALLAAALVSIVMSVSHTIRRSQPTNDGHLALAHSTLRDSKDCIFTFEPGWSLVASRLPPRETGPLIDSYAQQLLASLEGGHRFTTSTEAFATNPRIPPGLASCRYVIAGERGGRQVSFEQLEHTHQRTEREGLDLWERK